MEVVSATLIITILSFLLSVFVILGLVWLLPIFIQKQKAYLKRKVLQKKINEEMVHNIRYCSPSIVCYPQPILKNQDYGSTQLRFIEETTELYRKPTGPENDEVPSINITCDEDGFLQSPTGTECENNQVNDFLVNKNSLQNSKRRFSSIVFTHSDEVKVLTDERNLNINNDKRERRASMSLFDSCKLVCPELDENLSRSTEYLNQMILPSNGNEGKLYFILSNDIDNKGFLEVIIIKVTNITKKKQKEYQLQLELLVSEENVVYKNETDVRVCVGEVVNFDQSFLIKIDHKIYDENNDCLFLVLTFGNPDSKKVNKFNKIGEIRFDLMELIEGHVLKYNGREQMVICRNFPNLENKERSNENTGKIFIFLRFSKSAPLNIVIGIIELKDLRSSKPFTSINVRISLATEEKVLESRRSKLIKTKYQTSEGILKVDESFEFNLSSHKSQTKKIIKSQLNNCDENVFLTVFICGRNNIGFSHVLGKCVIGPIEFADGTGLFHWNDAICNLGEIIYHWHKLRN